MQPPEAGHGLGVDEFEDTFFPVGPLDVAGTVVAILQEFKQELPQVRGRT